MSANDSLWKSITAWASEHGVEVTTNDKLALLVDLGRLLQREQDHDHRFVKRQVKELRRQLGQAGSRIYDLRCQLEESRKMNTVDPTAYRGLLTRAQELAREVTELQEKLEQKELV